MKRTATDLRSHLYEVLDQVAKTGIPVEVSRGGVDLCIVRKSSLEVRKTKRAPRVLKGLIVGNPDDLIHSEWAWNEGRDL